MPVGTPFHPRTSALCVSLNYRDWSGYYAVSAYETQHEHEYNAIRNGAALIDISPLFKYELTGPDASRLVDRVIPRDASKLRVGQVVYTPWCDDHGRVLDDGTVARLDERRFRWTAAEPTLRWLQQHARGLDVRVEDVSETTAALALQGPCSALVLRAAAEADIDRLRYFQVTSGTINGVRVDISRTGYTGDLGYEIWVPTHSALTVWDALMHAGGPVAMMPAGMLALDVARIEAGLLLLDVDFTGSKKAVIPSQAYTPYELGLARLVEPKATPFVGASALALLKAERPPRMIVGLEVDWNEVESVYERVGLPPVAPAIASRVAVPVTNRGRPIGRATSTTWSPVLKRMIALATIAEPHYHPGTRVAIEITIEARHYDVGATVVRTPFFDPPRKKGTPPEAERDTQAGKAG